MTEAEWFNDVSADLHQMWLWLEDHRRAVSIGKRRRKARLFACACCRRIWKWLSYQDRTAIELVERCADGFANQAQLNAVGLRSRPVDAAITIQPEMAAIHACGLVFVQHAKQSDVNQLSRTAVSLERKQQVKLLREIFGNPFRPAAVDASWLSWNGRTVPMIAQAIYDERAFERLPILADALEDAGCGDTDILRHCREPGEHVRGCWVIDLLLGKE
jgi:hypothetical protein